MNEAHLEDSVVLLREIGELKESLRLEKSKKRDINLSKSDSKDEEEFALICNMKSRRTLKGHRGRLLYFDWSMDRNHLITAGQDGFACIWNAYTGQKTISIQTTSPWVTSCAYAPSTTLVACGGMDSQCSIYNLQNYKTGIDDRPFRISHPSHIMAQHSKYLTHCAFFGSDQQLLTSSADTTCALWDLEMTDAIQSFRGHNKEVLGLALHPKDPCTIFASCSLDRSIRIWDVRTGRCEMKFETRDAEVNAVKFFPGGEAMATAGNDGIIHLFDLRSDQEVRFYSKPSIVFGATSVEFSKSGHVLFAGYEDYSVRAWDVLKGTYLTMWMCHQDRISHILLSPDGTCLGISSWDGSLRLFTQPVSCNFLQGLGNSCTGEHQPNTDVLVEDLLRPHFVTVSQERKIHKPDSRTERWSFILLIIQHMPSLLNSNCKTACELSLIVSSMGSLAHTSFPQLRNR